MNCLEVCVNNLHKSNDITLQYFREFELTQQK